MDFRAATIGELAPKAAALAEKSAFLGFDGFVDTIVAAVGLRTGLGEQFEAIPTLAEFGRRIAAAAGKSSNIELFPRLEKLGGNGPIMAHALLAAGANVRYVGALGRPAVHSVFRDFAARTQAVSLCTPGLTTAVEFTDGKLMLGTLASLEEITFEHIIAVMGETALREALGRADLVALVNWTMVPQMSSVFAQLVERVLPHLPPRDRRFFFDLADPEKRPDAELRDALALIARFEKFGRVVLGLNLKEAQHIHRVLGFPAVAEDEAGLREMARAIRQRLDLATVVLHPVSSAACATRESTFWVPGPFVAKPLITTGAGDHFNAGFMAGQLLGLSPQSCLGLAVTTSGFYVRTARSPSLAESLDFLRSWQ